MKPIVIRMQAFGPFAGQQVVDFRRLGSKTFFLIHGPTGSGKTTILDAMCFALFGDSSGGERDGRQMRSHHADAETLTEVGFDFALGDRHYRVHRIPEQMRKSRRGGGETRQLQEARFFRLEQQGGKEVEQTIESGWSKVTAAVEKLLGFESRQFRQVIMLPQGKFFEFLKSNSQEREKILQTLFGTEIYKRIEEQLSRAAADVAQKAATLSTQRQTLLGQANVEDEPTLAARLVQQAGDLAAGGKAEQDAATAAAQAEAQLAQARSVGNRFDELDKAALALQTLKVQESEWTSRRTQLARARQAASIQPHATAVETLDKQLAQEQSRLEQCKRDAEAAAKVHKEALAAMGREQLRAPELELAIAQVAKLETMEGKVIALDSAKKDLDAASGVVKKTHDDRIKAEKDLKDASDAHRKLAIEVQAHTVLVAGLDGLRANHKRLAQNLEQALNLAKATAELTKAKRLADGHAVAVKSATESVAAARQEKEKVHQAWIASQAARLARELVAGHACPVCGALDHPEPAHASGELVLDETLKTAEDELTRAETALRTAEGKLAEAQKLQFGHESRIGEIQATLAGVQDPPEQLKAQCEEASAALNKADAAALGLKDLNGRLEGTRIELTRLETEASEASRQATEAVGRQHQCEAVFNERQADIPADLTDIAKLKAAQTAAVLARDAIKRARDLAVEAVSQANAEVARLQGLKQGSEQTHVNLMAQQATRSAELAERLTAAAFTGMGAFRAACLTDQQIVDLESGLQAFDTTLLAAALRHERAGVDTRELLRPDIAAIESRHEAAKAAHLAASNAVRDALAAHNITRDLVEALQRLAGDYQALQARYAIVRKVADVATGNNDQRMSFQRYVLATLLEEVLVATTVRLRVMSRGRYEMRRKLQAADQRSAAGLDLEVFDHYTGMTRAVSTLSGGESFLASLALALGLSDVVQSYAGGIRLDAIFVDEGFGTLDPEALEFAIMALKDLQQAGRMVGIISHVAELREWIDARLELKAGPTGSVAQFEV